MTVQDNDTAPLESRKGKINPERERDRGEM